jgi:hypothetical protein
LLAGKVTVSSPRKIAKSKFQYESNMGEVSKFILLSDCKETSKFAVKIIHTVIPSQANRAIPRPLLSSAAAAHRLTSDALAKMAMREESECPIGKIRVSEFLE